MESGELFQCPACKDGRVTQSNQEKKSLLGGKTVTRIVCNRCGALFMATPEGYALHRKPVDKKAYASYADLVTRYYPRPLKAEEWDRIAQGGVSDKEQAEIAQKQAEEELLERLQNGDLSALSTITDVPILLKKDEQAYVSLGNVQYVEERTRTTYVGGSRGVSIHAMKGVSFRVGGFKAERVPIAEKIVLDRGNLTITNRRVILSGPSKNVSFPIGKIMEVEEYKDGISISREGKQKTEYYLGQFELPNLKYHSVWMLVRAIIRGAYQST